MKRKAKSKKKQVPIIVNIFLLLLTVIFQLVAILLIFDALGYFDKKLPPLLYSYKVNNNLKYEVFLKENDFIDEKSLGMNEVYIADLVDYIEINYDYLFSGSKSIDLTSDYRIDATIYGEYQMGDSESSSKIWSKEYSIASKDEEEFNDTSQIDYKKKIKLPLGEYEEEVRRFQSELRLPMTSKLIVRFSSLTKSKEYGLNKQYEMSLVIPLNEQVFAIDLNYEKEVKDSIYDTKGEYKNSVSYSKLIGSVVLIIVTSFGLYKEIRAIIKVFNKNKYMKILNKIKHDYDEVIVDVTSIIELDNYQVVEVRSFDELIDLEEEVRIPILSYEAKRGKENWFVIIHENLAYRYTLRSEDVK